jgi:hypothetical protein
MDSDLYENPMIVLLYEDEDVQIIKNPEEPEYLYLVQDEFEETDIVELNQAQQLALYAILKNRFEA